MEEGIDGTKKETNEGTSGAGLQAPTTISPSAEFVKVEKNLASLGFFTPSSKRSRNEKSKTVAVTVVVDGKRIEAKATIAPTALFGLPITADQDKWLALHKILSDMQARDGQIVNPVSFTSAELLALLKIYRDSGKNYKDVSDWLDVMVGTTIISEGAVYSGGRRIFGKDRFHVFDHAVSFGKQLPDGSIADRNYVWLSQWQLQNINDHHQLPIDLDTYRQLKNFIARALVPLLQIWLYATRDDGVYEKRYKELCEILNIRQWEYVSKIKEKLGPSLDELKQFGYLSDWRIERTSDNHAYKILFFHGEKFHRDQHTRLSRKQNRFCLDAEKHSNFKGPSYESAVSRAEQFAVRSSSEVFDAALVAEFTRRGITERKAAELLANVGPGRDVLAQLEQIDQMMQHAGFHIENPAGFVIRMFEKNIPVPDGFESSTKRKAREEQERQQKAERDATEARQQLEDDYENYCDAEIDRYIAVNHEAFDALKDAKWREDRARFTFTTESMARIAARNEIRKQLSFLTIEEFLTRKREGSDFSLKLVAVSPAVDVAVVAMTPAIAEVPVAADPAVESEPGTAVPEEPPIAETATIPTPEPVTPGPLMIELASEPPHTEPGGTAAEQGIA